MSTVNTAKTRGHFIVHGIVRSVNYRDYIKQMADRLGLEGFAKNLLDGTVEIVSEGERRNVIELRGSLKEHYDFSWELFRKEFTGKGFEIR